MSSTYRRHLAEVVRQHGPAPDSAAIVSLIEKAMKDRKKHDDADRDFSRAHVSDAGRCPRQIYRSITGNREVFSTDSLINFAVGRSVEEWFAETLEALGCEVFREIAVEVVNPFGGPNVPGHIDFLVIIPPQIAYDVLGVASDRPIVIELKSTNSRAMGFIIRANKAKADHEKQLRLYAYAAKNGSPATIETFSGGDVVNEPFDLYRFADADWYIVYVVKDATKGEPNLHAYLQEYDEEEARADLLFLATVNGSAAAKQEPEIPDGYAWKAFPCSYCSHRNDCFGR